LFPLLRVLVDRPGSATRFVILGSASPELLQQSSETLAGRIEYIEMGGFGLEEVGDAAWERLWERGGFPRAYLARSAEDSFVWRKQFVKTFLERDLPGLGIRISPVALERFWMMLAHRHGALLNASELASSFGISDHTARSYVDLLTDTFMLRQLPPWHENISKRQVKSPKIYFRDSGLLHCFLSLRSIKDLRGHPGLGASWEGFALEYILHLTGRDQSYFWATHAGAELDLLKWIGGKRIGFEIKYADAPKPTKSMHIAVEDLNLQRLLVVHPGGKTYPLTDTMTSVALRDLREVLGDL
jgi:predicted AAA+ superfamily ATPase